MSVGLARVELMFERIESLENSLREMVNQLDPDLLRPVDAAVLFQSFSRMQKLCSGAAMRLSPRAADAGVWKRDGDQSPADWISKQTGTSVSNAASLLETGRRLADLPTCDDAVRKGEISQRQAEEIASAAIADPQAQSELIDSAKTDGFAGLKLRCAKVRAAACPDDKARNEQIRRNRYLRYFSDEMGAFCLQGRFTPQAGAVLISALEPYKEQIIAEARKARRKERHEAYMADALVSMALDTTSSGPDSSRRRGPGAMMHITVDHSALMRGHTVNGEVCEIPGIGPIPVATAEALATDAFLSVIVTEGADIRAICRSGRHIPAAIRTALESRDPVCVVPGCEKRHGLQIDHIKEFAKEGPTAMDNLARLCPWHHYLKTHQCYRLTGGPGSWSFDPPTRAATDNDVPAQA